MRDGDPDIIAIDGKTSRRSHARAKGREPLHLVSAWASRRRFVLAQEAVDEKSNEIVAIPLLLERLALKGALVTIDAMGTQADIEKKIVARGGDDLLALKANRPLLDQEPSPSSTRRRRTCWSRRMRRRTTIMAASSSAGTSSVTRSTGCSRTVAMPTNRVSRIFR